MLVYVVLVYVKLVNVLLYALVYELLLLLSVVVIVVVVALVALVLVVMKNIKIDTVEFNCIIDRSRLFTGGNDAVPVHRRKNNIVEANGRGGVLGALNGWKDKQIMSLP